MEHVPRRTACLMRQQEAANACTDLGMWLRHKQQTPPDQKKGQGALRKIASDQPLLLASFTASDSAICKARSRLLAMVPLQKYLPATPKEGTPSIS